MVQNYEEFKKQGLSYGNEAFNDLVSSNQATTIATNPQITKGFSSIVASNQSGSKDTNTSQDSSTNTSQDSSTQSN